MKKRTDKNQVEIMAILRSLGASVFDLHEVGHGFPDLVVAFPASGKNILVEIKTPGRDLNILEQKFYRAWPGKIYIIKNPDEAVIMFNLENGGADPKETEN
jgi:hypothetical protein